MLIALPMSNTREAIWQGHQPLKGCLSVRHLPSCAAATGLFILTSHVSCEHLGQSPRLGSRVMSSVSSVTSLGGRHVWTASKLRLNITVSRHPLISSKSPNPHPLKSNSATSEIQFRTSPARGSFGFRNFKKTFQNVDTFEFFKNTPSIPWRVFKGQHHVYQRLERFVCKK